MEVTTGGSQHDFDFTVEKHLQQLVGDGLRGGLGGKGQRFSMGQGFLNAS